MKKFRVTTEVKNGRYYFIISEVKSGKVISKEVAKMQVIKEIYCFHLSLGNIVLKILVSIFNNIEQWNS